MTGRLGDNHRRIFLFQHITVLLQCLIQFCSLFTVRTDGHSISSLTNSHLYLTN